jgi:hypothetical protein
MIAEALQPLAVPVDQLTPFPNNPRKGDVSAIARSLETFGQRKPIVATTDGTVVAGNHTLAAAQQLGWPEIAVVWVTDDNTMAEAYALADNRTAELGHYDPVALARLIRSVQEADSSLMEAISYDAADLDDLIATLQEDEPILLEHRVPDTRYGQEQEGSYVEPDNEERLADYQTKGVRSLILDYSLDEYESVAAMAAGLRAQWAIASTASLFKALLERETCKS